MTEDTLTPEDEREIQHHVDRLKSGAEVTPPLTSEELESARTHFRDAIDFIAHRNYAPA